MLLHLGWHHQMHHEPWLNQDYYWLELGGIDPDLQEIFIDWVELIAIASKDGTHPVPYSAIFRPSGNFDTSGHYIDKHDGTGLTCATFILAMFADFKFPLIEPETWPRRGQDFRWFRKMFGKLRPYVDRVELVKQYFRRRELKRFRPEEVVAAGGIFAGTPLPFPPVEAKTRELGPHFPT